MGWFNGEWIEGGEAAGYVEVKDWCPECDPDGVPEPYTLRMCSSHLPSLIGSADPRAQGVDGAFWSSGHAEAGGESNSAWCRVIHRPR